jgi:long-subunit acyl-CoA synthetase (AMP-forming)
VSPRLLQRADALGLPVFEGYGLSECSSVVCLNSPAGRRAGSVGRPLPHVDLAIAADGEVVIRNSGFSGYLGGARPSTPAFRTGDIGELDPDGFLHLRGRRRNVFITAFGRNVAPEWVERELTLEAPIAQAAVFGEARPFNVAVVYPAAGASDAEVESAISRANRGLPDYARVSRWVRADEVFSPANGMLTGTGRIRRGRVWQHYRDVIESNYAEAISS